MDTPWELCNIRVAKGTRGATAVYERSTLESHYFSLRFYCRKHASFIIQGADYLIATTASELNCGSWVDLNPESLTISLAEDQSPQ